MHKKFVEKLVFGRFTISLRRAICRFRENKKVFHELVCTTAHNRGTNQETLDRIAEELENLELQDNLQRFREKRNVVRAINLPYLLSIPQHTLNAHFYNSLREKLEIPGKVGSYNFVRRQGNYRSPRDLVSVLVENGDATTAVVQKLFEKQYELRWHTTTGDPDQFSFYGLCQDVDQAGGENVMTYNTRRAHVISRLYHAQEESIKIRGLTYREHCPPVYVRTKINERWTWKKWICHPHRREFEVCAGETNIDWISNEPLRNYITVILIQCKIIIMQLFPTKKSIFTGQ